MSEILWRLTWALPCVLFLGIALLLMMKRFLVPRDSASQSVKRMQLRESIFISNETRIHLIEVDRQTYLITESACNTAVQSMSRHSGDAVPVARNGSGRWLERLPKLRTKNA